MKEYIIALDQGTTSSRAILFNKAGDIVNIAQKEFQQFYPKSGWVEHDPQEIWSSQLAVFTEVLAKSNTKLQSIKGIGITNQRETTVVWNRNTGEPIHKAIVWQDRRTADYCQQLIDEGHLPRVQDKTGLLIDSYFSATKIKWMLDHVEGARTLAENGELAFGTIDSWLIWNLTDGKQHVTDVTNASRSMLYNINDLKWDQELLDLFEIPRSMLPEVKSSSEIYGETSSEVGARPIPIAGIAGDQQAALFGQMCLEKGMAKNTYGTGCFLLMNIGDKPVKSQNKLVTTIGWQIGDKVTYALEGSIFIGGAVVQWLRDELKIIKKSSDIEALAQSVENTDGVYLVPAFAGLGAPHWNATARGTIFGISRGTTDAHIARAALESIAYQTYDILKAMEADSKTKIQELRVDGGATDNQFLLQFQANVLEATVVKPKITETTAMGAAFLAGLAVGFWKDVDEIQALWKEDQRVDADTSVKPEKSLREWRRAVEAVIHWSETEKNK